MDLTRVTAEQLSEIGIVGAGFTDGRAFVIRVIGVGQWGGCLRVGHGDAGEERLRRSNGRRRVGALYKFVSSLIQVSR